ncbi:MAG: shikimate kinase [Bifidobacteriaceae bacterium]|jgi:shikimate kinase|nr:shikimate kinase [Bifidobacteriaceae bacterium]
MSAIVLIGPPGAGKTTVGRELARALGLEFLDTDQMVEARLGRPVAEIFTGLGEAAFRAAEQAAVTEALARAEQAGLVLSVGGGAPLTPAIFEALRTGPLVVFLDVSAALALKRVGLNHARPLLAASPRKILRQLMDARRPTYEALADVTVKIDGLAPAGVAGEIARLVMANER